MLLLCYSSASNVIKLRFIVACYRDVQVLRSASLRHAPLRMTTKRNAVILTEGKDLYEMTTNKHPNLLFVLSLMTLTQCSLPQSRFA